MSPITKQGRAGIKEIPFKFPMKSVDDIQALENLLEDKKQVNALVCSFAEYCEWIVYLTEIFQLRFSRVSSFRFRIWPELVDEIFPLEYLEY